MLKHENGPIDAAGHEKLSPASLLIITVLLVSTFVVFLNETILGVALPQIMESLNIQASTGQWLNTCYMLTMAIVIPTTGYLQQRFTTRSLFMIAMGSFVAGTLVGALAPTFAVLLVARIAQAAGAAIMFPLLMTTIMTLVPESARGRIMGNIGIVMSVAPAMGPAVSGIILNFYDWRFVFWFVLPIAVVATIIGAVRIKATDTINTASIDIISVIYSIFAFGGLVYGLSSFGDAARGKAIVSPWLLVAIGAVFMVIFVLRQNKMNKVERALLDLRTFKSRNFSVAIGLMFLTVVVMFGLGILLPIYTQQGLGMDALTTGLIMLPGGLAMGLLSPVVGAMYDKWGARKLLIPASILVAAVLWFMITWNGETQMLEILLTYTVFMVGLGFFFTPLFALAMGSVEPQLYSHASATLGALQQVGGAAGTAIFVTLFTVASVAVAGANSDAVLSGLAVSAGAHQAFILGAVLWLATPVLALVIREPKKAKQS